MQVVLLLCYLVSLVSEPAVVAATWLSLWGGWLVFGTWSPQPSRNRQP